MSTHAVSERITTGLHKRVAEGHRVIWWADPQAEFCEAVADLSLDGAELIALAENPALAVKRRVELDGNEAPVVLYESRPAPEPEADWLLNIRLYAAPFAADATAMLQQDLGLYRLETQSTAGNGKLNTSGLGSSSAAQDIATVPTELFTKYQVSFYADPVDAAFKAIGVE